MKDKKTYCFGKLVKFARQEKGLTQSQLAERLHISTRHLKGIENSGRKPSYDLLSRIVCELGIFTDDICRQVNKKPKF